MTGTPRYRADVDGLRALAVLAVILFHAEVAGFGGGFIGVDVFFVISGFLITQLLEAGRGSLGERLLAFYARRARRILPALLAMLAVVTAVALWLLLPDDLWSYGHYLATTPVFLANVTAWLGLEYFAPQAATSPLLHLWSIAVEEQFYLVYPLALALLGRLWPRHRLAALAVIALTSLALSAWGASRDSVSNFYLPFSRAWELLMGAGVALGAWPLPRSARARELIALIALLTIIAAAMFYRPSFPYPGPLTIPICAATAALLADETQGSRVHRWLSSRPLVAVGLVSYSLYLWHLPVLALERYWLIQPAAPAATAAALALVALLAWASWRVVEQPLRSRRWLPSNARFVTVALATSVALAATGLGLWHSNGWPSRFSAHVQQLAPFRTAPAPDLLRCMRVTDTDIAAGRLCEYGPGGADAPRAIIWGDSHAMVLIEAYRSLAERFGFHLYFAGHSSCTPMLYPERDGRVERVLARCDAYNRSMLAAIERLAPQLVILNAYWSLEPGGGRMRPHRALDLPVPLDAGVGAVLDRIAAPGRTACVVLDPPLLDYDAPYALAMAERRGADPGFVQLSRTEAYARDAAVDRGLRTLAARPGVRVVDLKAPLCRSERCDVLTEGRSLYHDSNHLSAFGASTVAGELAQCFEPRAANALQAGS